MKTKITATLLFAALVTGSSFAQGTSWKSEPNMKFALPANEANVLSRVETYLGTEIDFSTGTATILAVHPNSPAETFGFKKGDVIVSIGNSAVSSEDSYNRALELSKPGDHVTVKFIRKGKEKKRKVQLQEITVYKYAQ